MTLALGVADVLAWERGRCRSPAASAAWPLRAEKPSQPGAATHIGRDSSPMYSATPWPSSQAGSASMTGPVCPPTSRACSIQLPNDTTGPTAL